VAASGEGGALGTGRKLKAQLDTAPGKMNDTTQHTELPPPTQENAKGSLTDGVQHQQKRMTNERYSTTKSNGDHSTSLGGETQRKKREEKEWKQMAAGGGFHPGAGRYLGEQTSFPTGTVRTALVA
jgi:hypothetical protein